MMAEMAKTCCTGKFKISLWQGHNETLEVVCKCKIPLAGTIFQAQAFGQKSGKSDCRIVFRYACGKAGMKRLTDWAAKFSLT